MNDNELFELCKEVYEKTGWGEESDAYIQKLPSGKVNYEYLKNWYDRNIVRDMKVYPLYTSDYLLEKLPKHLASQEKLNVTYFDEVPETGEICWRAEYTHLFADGTWDIRWEYQGDGDTPLKALLKLTIALHDAGVKL